MNTANICSDDLLKLLLSDHDDSQDWRRAMTHVDQCPGCQARLEQLAADDALWRDAQDLLSSQQEDANRAANGAPDRNANQHRDRSRRWPTAWTDSMARQMLSPASHPEMMGRIGRYDVERLIGSGGMGVVFKAFDTELNRPVAVKVLAPYLAGSGAARKRFAREARAAAAVVHEHVVAIHNVESDGEAPFLVMPFVAGESLQQRIDREGPLELCEILRIAMQTAAGLAAAHAQGLVHRDVKPSNILLEQGVERALLTDFGLARASDDASLTHTGYHPGTPQYMSPEQARGETVDCRSDLFSLGSVMYAMATGRPPFRAETSYGILRRVTDEEPRRIEELNSDIPAWLTSLITKLLAKSPDDRFADADHLAELLEACIAHVRQPAVNPLPEELKSETWGDRFRSQLSQQWRWGVRNPMFLLATVLMLVPLMVWVLWILRSPVLQTESDPDIVSRIGDGRPADTQTVNNAAESTTPAVSPKSQNTHPTDTTVMPVWNDDLNTQLNDLSLELDALLDSLQPE
ncbi:MAG: serine/threonine protein kinase [Planctomycetaceae bacterium]|nr:serine/threonine protein kinase [Planctomycetaceae bacterium]